MNSNIKSIILYDGTCSFCNKMLRLISKNDSNNCFKFISNESIEGMIWVEKYQLHSYISETMILIESNEFYIRGSAVKLILNQLPKFKWLKIPLQLIPLFILDFLYKIIAKNRYILADNCKL